MQMPVVLAAVFIGIGATQHRPLSMSLGGASLPMLTRVPSREQRTSDSVVHADNLPRPARARTKHDSLLAANAP